MLFILAMEPLQRLFDIATAQGYLSPLGGHVTRLRASLYADDAAVFLNPVHDEVQVVAQILEMFGAASGLLVNLNKCAVYPISCHDIDLSEVMQPFPCLIREFPCSYLGLPLHTRQLHRVDIQPLIEDCKSFTILES